MRIKAPRAGLCETPPVICVQSVSPLSTVRASHRSRWAALLPREHGSWALALEPLAVALLAAPSWGGLAIALAAVMLFLSRRPFQVAAGAGEPARRAAARAALVVLAGAGVGFVGVALGVGVAGPGWPLGAAITCAGVFAWFDRKGEARAVLAECAGAATFSALAGGVVLLAGGAEATTIAWVVSGYSLARAWTSILPVRVVVRRRKGRTASARGALAVAVVACVVAGFAAARLGAWVPAAWVLVFAVRTVWLVGPWAPAWPARRIGWMEAGLGLIAGVSTGLVLS